MTPAPILVARSERTSTEAVEVRSPFDGHLVSLVCQASLADAQEAAEQAHSALPPMARTTTDERRTLLERVSRTLLAREAELAEIICKEAGKPITLALGEVRRAAEVFHLAAGEAERFGGELVPVDLSPATRGYRCLVRRVPRGAVLAIGPFNFPLNLLAHKIAPAIAVGAPVVVKPPPQAPSAALLLGRIICELAPATWPAGFLSVLPCSNDVAERLVRDARFGVLSFTGSGPVGWKLKQITAAAQQVLELGGDAAVIVAADADLDRAAQRIAWGATAYAGQVCISVQRIFVDERVHAAFREKLVSAMRAIAVGDPRDPNTVSGPVIDDAAAERLSLQFQAGTLLTGGERQGRMLQPTLLESPTPDSALASDEVFGPVAALWSYRHFEDALAEVGRSRFGLQAGLYTNDLRAVFQAHDELQVGGLVVNDVPTLRVDSYPYGGTKASGVGREGGRAALEAYTEQRVLVINPG